MENCYNTGKVSGSSNYIGGVGGYLFSGRIENCYNTGYISGSDYVGGVGGYLFSSSSLENCYNTGKVSGIGNYAGGVVGDNRTGIKNCYNTGDVSGKDNVGGIAGYFFSGSIENCYNTGRVSGSDYVGGVVGYNRDSIKNCYFLEDTASKGIGGGTGSAAVFDKNYNFVGGKNGYNETDNLIDALNAWVDDNGSNYFRWNTIRFNSNGQSTVNMRLIFNGAKITKPDDPKKEGYTFDGWYTKDGMSDSDWGSKWNFDADTVESDMTLYAFWVKQCEVKFNSNGGSAVSGQTINEGAKTTKPDDPKKEGYAFGGWYTKDGMSDNDWGSKWDFDADTVESDMTLYAFWITLVKQCEVKFNSNGESEINGQTIDKGGKITKPDDPKKEGYAFDGWYTKDGMSDSDWGSKWNFDTDTVENDMTLYAKWSSSRLSAGLVASAIMGADAVLAVCIFVVLKLIKKKKKI